MRWGPCCRCSVMNRCWEIGKDVRMSASIFIFSFFSVLLFSSGINKRIKKVNIHIHQQIILSPRWCTVESTYGTHIHEKREERENRFTQTVADTVLRYRVPIKRRPMRKSKKKEKSIIVSFQFYFIISTDPFLYIPLGYFSFWFMGKIKE